MNITEKWTRMKYFPTLPLGDNRTQIAGCDRHIQLSREAAGEGSVLLKNKDNILPLKKGTKLAVFGIAQIDYVPGGGGSAEVYCKYCRNIYRGLLEKRDRVSVFDKLSLYYENEVKLQYSKGLKYGRLTEAALPEDLLSEARDFADTAIITICRYSEEGSDRKNDGEDKYFELSDKEKEMIKKVTDTFPKVIVTLNTGAMIDTSWFAYNDSIQAALMLWQGGMEGGLAAADIIVGDINPSGKLADTCAVCFEDYPSSYNFHESEDVTEYTDDIFVGYRYFETVPGKKERVVYPFGYGLSYTTFSIEKISACALGDKIILSAKVTNTGDCSGKEVVQAYYSAPRGLLGKSAIELCAFCKTRLLAPKESQDIILSFDIEDMASFDDTGIIQKSAYVLEKGVYKFFIGSSVRNITEASFKYKLEENTLTKQLTQYCAPNKLRKRLTESGDFEAFKCENVKKKDFSVNYVCKTAIPEEENRKMLIDVANGDISLDEFLTQLTDKEMIRLLRGHKQIGISNTGGMGNLEEFGIPCAMTADGPAGVRSLPEKAVETTAFPIATLLACSWNENLIERVGAAEALEAKENNMHIFLAPGLNIHRSPLCGRNFEYYSEDPLIAGKMAASFVRGVQSQGVAATPKHFACNNKETNRQRSDSVVSERALREIYLKGFEICVKEAKPWLIMTSYNKLNGTYTSENAELLKGILRDEWDFRGVVTTDWWNLASHAEELISGNDIRMPYNAPTDLEEKYNMGEISRNQLAASVKRILELIIKLG